MERDAREWSLTQGNFRRILVTVGGGHAALGVHLQRSWLPDGLIAYLSRESTLTGDVGPLFLNLPVWAYDARLFNTFALLTFGVVIVVLAGLFQDGAIPSSELTRVHTLRVALVNLLAAALVPCALFWVGACAALVFLIRGDFSGDDPDRQSETDPRRARLYSR